MINFIKMTLKKQVVSFVEYIVQSDAKENSPFIYSLARLSKLGLSFLCTAENQNVNKKLVNPQNMSWPQHKHSRFWKLHK